VIRIAVSARQRDDGWIVEATDSKGWRAEPRVLRRVGPASDGFPLPPDEEARAIPVEQRHRPLCTAADPAPIRRAYVNVTTRDPQPGDVEALGGYLCATLLGDAWGSIRKHAAGQALELALSWDASDRELGRLPWELMMPAPGVFLANDPDGAVAITRVVVGTKPDAPKLAAPLKVLFVVGSALGDRHIRPGSEYLGLLRRLETKELMFNSRLLVRTTSELLADELGRFEPAVVHFICHGKFGGSDPALELTAEGQQGGPRDVTAKELLGILGAHGELPSVVVLNACNTGGTPLAQEATPMAADLVAGGVPIVVAMAGRVADRACRLFTRRFYEALLLGESVVEATAEGRRAGVIHLGDPDKSVDWSFPAIFLSETAPPALALDQGNGSWASLQRLGRRYLARGDRNPRAFCGRLEVLEGAWRQLVAPGGAKPILSLQAELAHAGDVRRFGMTRLLCELAAQAAREGNVPCLLSFRSHEDPPTSLLTFAVAIARAIRDTRKEFAAQEIKLDPLSPLRTTELLEKLLGPGREPVVQLTEAEAYDGKLDELGQTARDCAAEDFSAHRNTVLTLLRSDIRALEDEAAALLPGARVIVLLDDVHRYDAAATDVIAMLSADGLGEPGAPIPVVFAFATGKTENATATRLLTDYLERKDDFVERVTLGPFQSPTEDRLPYHQFLLLSDTPRVVVQSEDELFAELHQEVEGVPSNLKSPNERVDVLLRVSCRFKVLEEADDDRVLEEMRR
jgi:hypothetical protein